jgi:uncharacterized protein YbaR (Trm112 family)
MAPFEAPYGRHCRTPLNWIESGEKAILCPNLITEAKATVYHIQDNLKVAKLCQESYTNKRCRSLEFEVRNHVYLCV